MVNGQRGGDVSQLFGFDSPTAHKAKFGPAGRVQILSFPIFNSPNRKEANRWEINELLEQVQPSGAEDTPHGAFVREDVLAMD